ncbi:hypothetical protein HI914_04475 [Erysiphe necator]|nr:hypothetical protein HI914_04475 [Erysiphe necator]
MSPYSTARKSLETRYTCDLDGFCFRTPWDIWGRWVVFAVIAIIIISLAYLFSRQSNLRRFKYGSPPVYGTGWMSAKNNQPSHHQPNNFMNHNNISPQVPPYYSHRIPPTFGQHFSETTSQENGTFMGINRSQNEGIELTQPKFSHQRLGTNEIIYEPPPGPPPGKVM